MIKDFTEWHGVKTEIQQRNPPSFREREIWWCHLGLNVGTETDGKGPDCRRPVVVIRKFNRRSLLAIPLTTQVKDYPFYYHFTFRDRAQCAMLPQLKTIDSLRLIRKMGDMPTETYARYGRQCATCCKNIQPRF